MHREHKVKRENQQDSTNSVFIIKLSVSTCFGHHYVYHQENKTVFYCMRCSAWLCRLWLAVVLWSCVVSCVHCVHTAHSAWNSHSAVIFWQSLTILIWTLQVIPDMKPPEAQLFVLSTETCWTKCLLLYCDSGICPLETPGTALNCQQDVTQFSWQWQWVDRPTDCQSSVVIIYSRISEVPSHFWLRGLPCRVYV